MRMALCAVVLVMLAAPVAVLNAADGDVPAEVRQAAVVGLPRFLIAVSNEQAAASARGVVAPSGMPLPSVVHPPPPDGHGVRRAMPSVLSDYGFNDAEELSNASLGEPLQMYMITPAALRAYKAGDAVDSLLTTTTRWYFPVRVGAEIRSVLLVEEMAEGWKAVAFGQARVASGLDSLLQQWPSSSGYYPKLIVVFQACQFLFHIPERGADNLTPLADDAGNANLHQASDVVTALIPVVEANIAAFTR